MHSTMNIHSVKSISLSSSSPLNGNARTIRIETEEGTFSLTVFGETDALAALEKSSDYEVYVPRSLQNAAEDPASHSIAAE